MNQDGSITSADVSAIYDVLLCVNNRFLLYSDVDGDGSVTAGDITTVYSKIMVNN